MPSIKCDCGSVHTFTDAQIIERAGKPFTCGSCGKTRRLPPGPSVRLPLKPPEVRSVRRWTAKRVLTAWTVVSAVFFFASCLIPKELWEIGQGTKGTTAWFFVGLFCQLMLPSAVLSWIIFACLRIWKNTEIPVAKRLMLAATILWPVGMIGCWIAMFFVIASSALSSERAWVNAGNGRMVQRSQFLGDALVESAFSGPVCPTVLYAVVMVVLGVYWFATKPEKLE